MKKYLIVIIVVLIGLVADQYSKQLIVDHVKPPFGEDITVIEHVARIVYVENPGVTFGMFRAVSRNVRRPILLTIPILVLCMILYLIRKTKKTDYVIIVALSSIVAGALGNIIDRVRFDYVIDFIYLNFYFGWWPAFNVADLAIIVGMVLISVQTLRGKPLFQ
jgi:signal peptidase II